MKIVSLKVDLNYVICVEFDQGLSGYFDVKPYLKYEAFIPLNNIIEFKKIHNRGYYIEWDCGADLSADTIECRLTATADA